MQQVMRIHFGFKLDYIHEFNEYFEETIQRDLSEMQKQYEARFAKELDEDARLQEEFNAEDERNRLETKFVQLFRRSVVVMIHGYVEGMLTTYARLVGNIHCPELTLDDIGGKGVPRALTYLTKVYGATINVEGNAWQQFTKLSLLRNLIVHADGSIAGADSPDKVRNVISNTPGLSEASGEVVIDRTYVDSVLAHVREAVNEVVEAVQTHSVK